MLGAAAWRQLPYVSLEGLHEERQCFGVHTMPCLQPPSRHTVARGQSACVSCSLGCSTAVQTYGLIICILRRVKDAGEIEAAKPVQEGLTAVHVSALLSATEAQPGDLLLIAAGPPSTVNKCVFLPMVVGSIGACCRQLLLTYLAYRLHAYVVCDDGHSQSAYPRTPACARA